MQEKTCVMCGAANETQQTMGNATTFNCQKCGTFRMSDTLVQTLKSNKGRQEDKGYMSSVVELIRQQQNTGTPTTISPQNVEEHRAAHS